jgi:hypothetical protein
MSSGAPKFDTNPRSRATTNASAAPKDTPTSSAAPTPPVEVIETPQAHLRAFARALLRLLILIATIAVALYALGIFAIPQPTTYNDGYGDIYQGVVLRGQFIGNVDITFADGSHYSGGLKDMRFNGQGTYISSEGWHYTGVFKDGAPQK